MANRYRPVIPGALPSCDQQITDSRGTHTKANPLADGTLSRRTTHRAVRMLIAHITGASRSSAVPSPSRGAIHNMRMGPSIKPAPKTSAKCIKPAFGVRIRQAVATRQLVAALITLLCTIGCRRPYTCFNVLATSSAESSHAPRSLPSSEWTIRSSTESTPWGTP